MSRRLRQRREAIESRYVAMHSDDDEADWEDADLDSLAVYREAESTDQPISAYTALDERPHAGIKLA